MSTTPPGSQVITPPPKGTGSTHRSTPIQWKRRLMFLLPAIFLLGVGYWYWNQKVDVQISVNPVDASILLDGKRVSLSTDGTIQVKRGKHLLEAVSPGFSPHQEELRILFKAPPRIEVTLKELPGLISVFSEPDGATVTIGGTDYGKTPINGLELDAGEYRVRIEKENYLPHSQSVTIEGRRERVRIDTTLTPAWSRVSLNSTPEGATLFVNNEAVGNTPVQLDLLMGSYDLRLEMPEREPQSFNIQVPANQTINLPTRALEWQRGTLFLGTSPEGAWVTANNETLGQTPGNFSIPSRTDLKVKVALRDHEEVNLDLRVEPGETVERRLELEPFTGDLLVETQPNKAEVYLNGRIQGLSPVTLTLPVKEHTVEIRKAGYIPQTHSLRPLANSTARFAFTLSSEDRGTPLSDDQILQALIAGKDDIPREVSTPYGSPLKLIEPDTYTMGLPEHFPGRHFEEKEIRMRIRHPFYIGVYEVTNREFKLFKTGHDSGTVKGVSLQSGDRPVVGVSWQEAAEYCNWLSNLQGLKPAYKQVDDTYVIIEPRTDGYRLPTEAEWEYVARYENGSPSMVYTWGNAMPPTDKSGNFAGEEAKVMLGQSIAGYRDGYRATAPVGSFNPNPLGLYDLGGNVAEWCSDYYSYTYPEKPRPLVDYAGPKKGDQRHIRGSSWRSVSDNELRSTQKRHGKEGADDVGFRLVRSYPIIVE